jgi:DNA polymerase, archaea type
LEYEGYFPRGIFVSTKSSSRGAKKKYALLKEDGSIKITGFETVRRNWSFLAKEVQRDVLKFVLENKVEEALAYIKGVVNDLKKGIVPLEKLILKTQITRPLDKYKAIGPHIYVARQMAAKGELVGPGTLVKYIITQGSGLVRDRARLPQEVKEGEYASDYYINHQIIPAVSSILAIFGYSEEDLFNESSQKGLGSFF